MTTSHDQDAAAAASTPEGDGPITLGDRTGGGVPASNQRQGSPPAAAADVPAPVPVDDLNVGAADAQSPSHQAASTRPFVDAASGAAPAGSGTAQRATGSQGVAQEPIETHRTLSAAAMGAPSVGGAQAPGDAQGVPVVSSDAAEGTSESAPIVKGARTPVE